MRPIRHSGGIRNALSVLVFLAVAAFAAGASAQARRGAGGGGAAAGGGGGQAGQTTTYNFDDDIVQGDLVRPDGERATARRRAHTQSLIRIREHFVPEMLKSVENL